MQVKTACLRSVSSIHVVTAGDVDDGSEERP